MKKGEIAKPNSQWLKGQVTIEMKTSVGRLATWRRRVLFGILTLLVLVFVFLVVLTLPRRGVTIANCQRIHEGMTYDEVEAILGGPGEPYTCYGNGDEDYSRLIWRGREGSLKVRFGPMNRVIATDWWGAAPDSYLDFFRRRLPW
jgi:hypothetical protein